MVWIFFDLLISSNSLEKHYHRLGMVFRRLDEYGAVINPSKWGIRPLTSKIDSPNSFPTTNSRRKPT